MHGRKSIAGKSDAKFLQQPDHIVLFNRLARHFGKAAGIVDIGFVQNGFTFVTKVVVKPLLSDIKTSHTVIRKESLAGTVRNDRGPSELLVRSPCSRLAVPCLEGDAIANLQHATNTKA